MTCRVTALALLACLAGTAAFAQSAPTPTAPQTAAPAAASPAAPGDPFGVEVTLTAKPIVSINGHANWDSAFETLVKSFKTLNDYLDKQGITPNGPAMTIYTQTDDTGFGYQAALPIAEVPKTPPAGEIALGKSPAGKALKFMHRGSYDAMDTTYEAITNFLDDKSLEAKDLFIEEYAVDPTKAEDGKLVVTVYVPIN